jgi:RND family efflux transporter MFP subunit
MKNAALVKFLPLATLALATSFLCGCPSKTTNASLPQEGKIPDVPVRNENMPLPAQSANTPTQEQAAPENTVANASVAEANVTTTAPIATRISGTVLSGKAGMMSFTPPGRLSNLLVRVGDRVRKGQTLALLDSADFEFRERLAVAGHTQAKAMYEQAKKDLEREEQLKKENVTSVAALERMTNGFIAAKATMEQAQVNLEMARKGVQDTKLPAPYDGVITKKLRSEGEWVGGGAPVYELYEIGETEISLRVPEAFLKKVPVGKQLTILCPSTGIKAPAKIVRVVPIVQEATRTFEVVAEFTKSGAGIYPGQFVEADLN